MLRVEDFVEFLSLYFVASSPLFCPFLFLMLCFLLTQTLFVDTGALSLLCKNFKEVEYFPGLLYDFFDVNGRAQQLMKWVVDTEVKEANSKYKCDVTDGNNNDMCECRDTATQS